MTIPHICWSKMDYTTVVIRLDNADENAEYRVTINGELCERKEDGLYYFDKAKPGERYAAHCEVKDEDEWVEDRNDVIFNFIPDIFMPKDSGIKVMKTFSSGTKASAIAHNSVPDLTIANICVGKTEWRVLQK